MTERPDALPHGPIREVLPDIFFVTGTMKTVLMEADWHFSRNMTIVRDAGALTLVNTVRLDAEGLAALEALGKVTNVVRIGALHGIDDAFYVERYGARYWAAPGMPPASDMVPDVPLSPDGPAPFGGCSVFAFETARMPEFVLHVDRAGGVLIACDALQNWLAPDEFFSDDSRATMTEMGFFQPANIGPVWMQAAAPAAHDFARLGALAFNHVLCGHGAPLLDTAGPAFRSRFQTTFGA